MIKIDNYVVEQGRFPDGTLKIFPDVRELSQIKEMNLQTKRSSFFPTDVTVTWAYDNDSEMTALLFITRYLQDHGFQNINLYMPYIPNARQDRIKSDGDVFTLKYFAEFINSFQFNKVIVLDPHSYVSEALIDRIEVIRPNSLIEKTIMKINKTREERNATNSLIALYPDEGAMKRYSDMASLPYAFGVKKRDWKTGKIGNLELLDQFDSIKGNDVLAIDDICCKGTTMYLSAKKLKELGAEHIYLYVTHCEKTIFSGGLLKSGLIDKIYTTDSIFRDSAKLEAEDLGFEDKIETFKVCSQIWCN